MDPHETAVYVASIAAVLVLGGLFLLSDQGARKKLRKLPRGTQSVLPRGKNVCVVGTLEQSSLESPISGTPCAAYRVTGSSFIDEERYGDVLLNTPTGEVQIPSGWSGDLTAMGSRSIQEFSGSADNPKVAAFVERQNLPEWRLKEVPQFALVESTVRLGIHVAVGCTLTELEDGSVVAKPMSDGSIIITDARGLAGG